MRNPSEKKHSTKHPNLFAYEQVDNWYFWPNNTAPVQPTMPEGFQAMPHHPGYSPLTVHNDWPKDNLPNASIFPYLLKPNYDTKYKDLYHFVQQWYQTSCAIIYDSPHSECKIIGSGCLTNFTDENGNLLVATARHNFQNIPEGHLFVRFFNYQVQAVNNDWLRVKERFLDLPVTTRYCANGGLDAGYLALPALLDHTIFWRYAKILPITMEKRSVALPLYRDLLNSPLAEGKYAMFHFAGGIHQISLGEIENQQLYTLYDDIAIQAGPGASGATVIWHALNKTEGCSIAVYRIIEDPRPLRRLIPFSEFKTGPRRADNIKAPYRMNPNFFIVPTDAYDKSGYEFTRWYAKIYCDPALRPEKPTSLEYNVGENQSCHHIIPVPDLLFLWTYLHKLSDEEIMTINQQVNLAVKLEEENRINKLDEYLAGYNQRDRAFIIRERNRYLKEINEYISKFKYTKIKEYTQLQLKKRYGELLLLLEELCKPRPVQDIYNKEYDISTFVWAYWNLFKGPGPSYRQDDPGKNNDAVDFSEKVRPARYNPRLWQCLKGNNSLHHTIQALKATDLPNPQLVTSLHTALTKLNHEWNNRLTVYEQRIHPYNENEWEEMGSVNGHPIYRVRPT